MNEIKDRLKQFVQARQWQQYHTSKELTRALQIEAAELSELFLWGKIPQHKKIAEEIADVMIYAIMLASKYSLDIEKIINSKIDQNERKYPVHKSIGSNKKYTEFCESE